MSGNFRQPQTARDQRRLKVARAQAIAALLGAGLSLQLLRTHIDAFVNTGRIDLGEIIIIARETP